MIHATISRARMRDLACLEAAPSAARVQPVTDATGIGDV